jgi:hypothetical protein
VGALIRPPRDDCDDLLSRLAGDGIGPDGVDLVHDNLPSRDDGFEVVVSLGGTAMRVRKHLRLSDVVEKLFVGSLHSAVHFDGGRGGLGGDLEVGEGGGHFVNSLVDVPIIQDSWTSSTPKSKIVG